MAANAREQQQSQQREEVDLSALACNNGVIVLEEPAVRETARGAFVPPISGELRFVVGNGHALWNSKDVRLSVVDTESGEELRPQEPLSPTRPCGSGAWDLALHGFWGRLMNNRACETVVLPGAAPGLVVRVPRGRVACVAVDVEAGRGVRWEAAVYRAGHDARVSLLFRADRGALEAALRRAMERAPAPPPPPSPPRSSERDACDEEVLSLTTRLSEAECAVADLQQQVVDHTRVVLDRESEHAATMQEMRVKAMESADRLLQSERARARLRERLDRLVAEDKPQQPQQQQHPPEGAGMGAGVTKGQPKDRPAPLPRVRRVRQKATAKGTMKGVLSHKMGAPRRRRACCLR